MIAACAAPAVRPSAMCSTVPAPPDAITGTFTASATARVMSRSYPDAVPSRSIEFTTISPGAEVLAAPDPVDRVETGGEPRAVDEHLVARRQTRPDADVLHLCGEHDALAAEGFGALADDVGLAHGHRVDADLLGAGLEHLVHVVDRADAAADGERHEHVVRDGAHGVEVDLALLRARLDVVEDDLVDLVLVELLREVFGRARRRCCPGTAALS